MFKKVRFEKYVYIKLIPVYYEIENYDTLWWNQIDIINNFKISYNEIIRLLEIHPFMEKKQAMKLLYQPNNISYDPNNFSEEALIPRNY